MATETGEERHMLTFLWRIENVGRWGTDCVWNGLGSSWLRARSLVERRFRFLLFPMGLTGKDEHLILQLNSDDSLSFPIDCEWSLIGSNGSPLVSGTMRKRVMVGNEPLNMSHCPTYKEVFVTRKSDFIGHDTLNVRFRFWKSVGNLSNNEFISCRTRLDAIRYSILWPIPEFSTLRLYQEVTTLIVLGDSGGRDNFLLKFLLEGVSIKDACATVQLAAVSISKTLSVTLKVSVLNNEQKVMKSMDSNSKKGFILNSKEILILPKFVPRTELLKKKNECLKNDVLTLRCEIPSILFTYFTDQYYYGFSNLEVDCTKSTFLDACCQTVDVETSVDVETTNVETSEISLHSRGILDVLREDLLILYKEQSMTDFKLRVDDVTFPVHKNILSARSPVFRAMFLSNMEECVSNIQDVPDLDAHTMNRMLIFLYGGTVEPDLHLKGVAKLYYAADKYQIQSLKQQCSLLMQSSIQASNVSDILTVADRHQDNELMSFVLDFFLNNFDEIMQNEEWEKFLQCDPALAGNIVHHVYKNKLSNKTCMNSRGIAVSDPQDSL